MTKLKTTTICSAIFPLFLPLSPALAAPMTYQLLLESDADRNDAFEVFVAGFDSFDALINSGPGGAGGAFSGINIGAGYSVGGLAYDGQYRMLLESDADRNDAFEVFVASFDTFDSLINSGPAGSGGAFSGINIGAGYSVGGFAYDGQYRMLLESDADRSDAFEVFVASFDTFDSLINSGPAGSGGAFSGINIGAGYSVGGFAYEFPQVAVSEPSTLALLAAGLAGLGFSRRRRAARPLASAFAAWCNAPGRGSTERGGSVAKAGEE